MAVFASKTDIQFLISKIKSALSGKVDMVSGKGLSTNDYTTAEKNKLAGIADGANAYQLPTASASTLGGVKVGSNLTISNGVLSGTPNTTYSAMTGASASSDGSSGLVPAPSAGAATRYLRSDGTWVVPPDTNTTYSDMTAATSSAAGTHGLVPAPAAGKQSSFLRGDGTWAVPTDTTYSDATTSVHGLMTASDKTKLNGIATGAQVNVIETVKVNGTALTPSNKAVDITTPTTATIKSQIEAYGYQTSSQVQAAVNNAVGKITGISLSVVTSLPTTGATGTIYLIAHSHSDSGDNYDEYIWLADSKSFEKIGNTDVDLSDYVKSADLSEIGTTELTTMWNA